MSTDQSAREDSQGTRVYNVPVSSFYERGGDVSDEAFKKWSDEVAAEIQTECRAAGVKALIVFDESGEAQRVIAQSLNAIGRRRDAGTNRVEST